MGRPDSWRWPYDRSINPGLRFPFELMCRFGWQVTGPGGYWLVHSILSSIQSSILNGSYVVTRSRPYHEKPMPSAKGFFIHDRRVGKGRAGKAGHGIYTIVI